MGRIFIRNGRRKKSFVIQYFDQYGIRKYESFSSKKEAKRILRKRETDVFENKYFDIRQEEKVTFDEVAKMYLEYSAANKRSYRKSDVGHFKTLLGHFHGLTVNAITPYCGKDTP